jgi:hypothetical protein
LEPPFALELVSTQGHPEAPRHAQMTVRQALARTVEQERERQRTPAQLNERDWTRAITWGDAEHR